MQDFGDFLWGMFVFFFWFAFIWMFIGVFADVFRRSDLSGWGKAGWLLLIVVLPFLGILVYMIARPVTAQDEQAMSFMRQPQAPPATYSRAEEIERLARLRDSGTITAQEFDRLKQSALAT